MLMTALNGIKENTENTKIRICEYQGEHFPGTERLNQITEQTLKGFNDCSARQVLKVHFNLKFLFHSCFQLMKESE